MSTQVNLLQPGLQERREFLTLNMAVLFIFLVYASLLGLGGWHWWQAVERQKAVAAVEGETKKLKAQMDELSQKAAKANPQLAAEIEQVQAQVRAKDDMARLLESKASTAKNGFSEALQGLAKQIPEGLWLTSISIGDGGNDIEIRGSMNDTAALPEYIHRLGDEPSFRGRVFSTLSMTRATSASTKATTAAPIGLAVQDGVATPELQSRLTARTGAFVGVAPVRANNGALGGVVNFVLVPQKSSTREVKP